jgi:hypothetical protein
MDSADDSRTRRRLSHNLYSNSGPLIHALRWNGLRFRSDSLSRFLGFYTDCDEREVVSPGRALRLYLEGGRFHRWQKTTDAALESGSSRTIYTTHAEVRISRHLMEWVARPRHVLEARGLQENLNKKLMSQRSISPIRRRTQILARKDGSGSRSRSSYCQPRGQYGRVWSTQHQMVPIFARWPSDAHTHAAPLEHSFPLVLLPAQLRAPGRFRDTYTYAEQVIA